MNEPGYLAFETGGTKLVAGIAGPNLRLIETRTLYRKPEDTAAESLRGLIQLGWELKADHQLTLQACGLGFGGYVQRSQQRPLANLHEPGWDEVNLTGTLEKEFGIPVRIENDCKVAALAEAHFGAGRDCKSVFYITLGTGVGGGIVRDGRIVEMSDVGETEIGHVVVLPEGPLCACGNQGCVEALASGPGLSKLTSWMAAREPALWNTSDLNTDDRTSVPAKDLMAAWAQGDTFAKATVEQAASSLGFAVSAAINLLAPEAVVIGGGVAIGNPAFVDLIHEKTDPLVAPCFREHYRIALSELGEQVVTQGAAILAAQQA